MRPELSPNISLSKEHVKWIVPANVFAWPLAYYFMRRWLEGFAYHTSLNIMAFFASGLLALFIALLTVSFQTIKAAAANPVDSLRYE
jgi:putative ABC transport system permease protein